MRVVFFFAVAVTLAAQPRFPMRRVLDLGPLQEKGGRVQPAGTGLTVEVSDGEESRLTISGADDAGLPWRVESDIAGMFGMTTLWRGDLDNNGREDWMLGSIHSINGLCTDGATVTILLMGADGRPTPWTTYTHFGYRNQNLKSAQPFLTDVDGNGHAELIQVACERTPQVSEIRTVDGIYEAHEGRMVRYQNIPASLVRRATDRARPTPPSSWKDQFDGIDRNKRIRLQKLITSYVGCTGFRLVVTEDLRLADPQDDPCSGLGDDRILYSDGVTRVGWPKLVLDSQSGRQIILNGDGSQLRTALELDAEVRILGDPKSPDWLWLHLDSAKPATSLQQRLFIEPLEDAKPIADFAFLYTFGPGDSYAKESVRIQLSPEPPSVRVLRSYDQGLLWERKLARPEAAAKFTGVRQYHNGYLAQWAIGPRRILTLHREHGELIGPPHPQVFAGELLWGDPDGELHFLIRKQGKPTSIVRMRSHVEWSR